MAASFLLPLALGAGSALAGYLTRDRTNPYDRVQFPTFDYGARQQALQSRLGTESVAAGQAAGRSLTAQGLNDTSRMAETQGRLNAAANAAQVEGTAALDELRRQNAMQLYRHNLEKELFRRNMPDLWDYLGGGAKIAGSAAMLTNPGAFAPKYSYGAI